MQTALILSLGAINGLIAFAGRPSWDIAKHPR